jgi:hypothetical protein
MNFYSALTNGDGSLKEPHITSILYYLLKETSKTEPKNSFLEYFCKNYLPEHKFIISNLDPELDIKIEETFRNENTRRDTDIVIYLKDHRTIINIENKINSMAYDPKQISDQESVINANHPNSQIISFLILPCQQQIEKTTNHEIIYWVDENLNLITVIKNYIIELKGKHIINERFEHFLTEIKYFFEAFEETIEQQCLSNESRGIRGPKTKYPRSMKEYLTEISENWDFPKPHEVTVGQLLEKFDALVCQELIQTFGESESGFLIEKFRRGALEAQPKIFTINESNRIHFGKVGNLDKRLFYYPGFPDGNYNCRWKDVIIAPIHYLEEPHNIHTFTNC